DALVAKAEQAVVVGVFASNVHRMRMLGEIARKHGRRIVPLGRSVGTHTRVARATRRATGAEAGTPYLEWPSDLVWPVARARCRSERCSASRPARRGRQRRPWPGSAAAITRRSTSGRATWWSFRAAS